ncbi:MAG: winged helix-turn-helix domain-containing protein [Phycisphaera sp.]|nr:winged helix-turn-helix domain-containing protein [Phycisphaera sp.]
MNRNYRTSDPPTSALAGREMEVGGAAKQQRAMCLAALVKTPGATAREIEDCIGIKAHKRLPELRADGLVCNGPARTCRVSGRQAITWYAHICGATPNNGELQCH